MTDITLGDIRKGIKVIINDNKGKFITLKIIRNELERILGLDEDSLSDYKDVIKQILNIELDNLPFLVLPNLPIKRNSTTRNENLMCVKVKKRIGPFTFFLKEQYPIVRAKNPEIRTADATKIIGKMWKKLTDQEKQPYVSLSLEDKKRVMTAKTSRHVASYTPEELTMARAHSTRQLLSLLDEDDIPQNDSDMSELTGSAEQTKDIANRLEGLNNLSRAKGIKAGSGQRSLDRPLKRASLIHSVDRTLTASTENCVADVNLIATGYHLFVQEMKDVALQLDSDICKSELLDILSRVWKLLPKVERDGYESRLSSQLANANLTQHQCLVVLFMDRREMNISDISKRGFLTNVSRTVKALWDNLSIEMKHNLPFFMAEFCQHKSAKQYRDEGRDDSQPNFCNEGQGCITSVNLGHQSQVYSSDSLDHRQTGRNFTQLPDYDTII